MKFLKPLFFINMLSGSDYIVDFLQSKKVEHIFGYSGGSNLHLLDKIGKSSIKVITNRHEQFSGHSAEGYAKLNNDIGIILTTSGPGVTNMITPLQDAYSDSIPLFLITGNVAKKNLGTQAFQEVNSTELTKPCTKWNYCIQDIKELPSILEKGYNIALEGKKGPVHIDICSDIFSKEIDMNNVSLEKKLKKKIIYNSFEKKDFYRIENRLRNSKKPVFILGKGGFPVVKQIRQFSKEYNIPIATTLHGLGIIDEREPLSLGMVGMHGTPYANKLIQESDLIIGIGNRFDDRTIGNPETYGINAKKKYGIIHIDISKKNIDIAKKVINSTISLECSSEKFMEFFSKEKFMGKKDTLAWVQKMKKDYPLPLNKENKLCMSDIVRELGEFLKNTDCILTTGVGNHQMVAAQHFKWNYPQQLLTSGSLGTMGTGLPFAIGAQLKNPNRQVICIDGDGSFMMSCQELATIRENNLPIKIILLDNKKLQMVYTWQDLFYNKNFITTENINPCFKTLGKSFGIETFSCSKKSKIRETLQKVLFHNGPVLAHFQVESENCLPFVKPGSSLEDMLL